MLRYDETLNDEPVTAREMIMEMNHPLRPPPAGPDQEDSQ